MPKTIPGCRWLNPYDVRPFREGQGIVIVVWKIVSCVLLAFLMCCCCCCLEAISNSTKGLVRVLCSGICTQNSVLQGYSKASALNLLLSPHSISGPQGHGIGNSLNFIILENDLLGYIYMRLRSKTGLEA